MTPSEPDTRPSLPSAALDVLLDLLDTPSPSGFEGAVAAAWGSHARASGLDVSMDGLGNVFATANPQAGRRVLLVGHLDEIGLIITRIDDKGFLRVAGIGGWDVGVLLGQRVRIEGQHGPVFGTIGRAAVHTLDAEARGKVPKITDVWVDIGAGSGDEAREHVRVGDPAVIDGVPLRMGEHRLVSRSLDNRIGALVALEAARRSIGADVAVTAVGSIGEEIGGHGAAASATGVKPDAAVVIDVTTPGDTPKAGDIPDHLALGGGPILTRGATTHRGVVAGIAAAAERAGIAIQWRGLGQRTATDADHVARAGAGVSTGLISVPARYLHSPNEQVDLRDVEAAIALLTTWISGGAGVDGG